MRIPRVLALVLAGGKGERLHALTEHKVKPALPVAGTYRLIDVSMSNLMHSHVSDVWVVQQYLPHGLNRHLANGRPWDLDRSHGGLQILPPYQGAEGEGFAEGNTDSLYRQKELVRDFAPDLVLVLSADHLYTLNFLDVVDTHLERGADLTVVTTLVDEEPTRYGVVRADDDGRVTGFEYKPERPEGRLVAAEIFLYDAPALLEALDLLHERQGRLEDYGDDLVPWFVAHRTVVEHRLEGYWMDMGTLQAYWTAHLQLLDGDGAVLDDPDWPILTAQPQLVPARIAASAEVRGAMVAAGSLVHGTVEHSVLGPGTVVEEGASVRHCVLLDGVRVAAGTVLENVVADMGAEIPAGEHGTPGAVTLIAGDGQVRTAEEFDRAARLPRGF
ncbi:glucose-1-phosphate adenylyltransferase family protein [Kocuria sp. M1R5S2]|uniref:glucose-1-phosphate adenylyltransferase family protein n=1 Tax=Kocuria rhizosphaerae TaxID=3376285 RepID=UPI0037B3E9D4